MLVQVLLSFSEKKISENFLIRTSALNPFGDLNLGGLLVGDAGLLAHGGDDGDEELLALVELITDLGADITIGDLDIILGVTLSGQQVEEVIIDVQQGVLNTGDVGDIHVVGGGRQILELLAGEDVNGDQVDLGVTVLAGLGGRHINDLAGTALDDNVSVLAESRALHGEGQGSTGGGTLELNVVLLVVVVISHFVYDQWRVQKLLIKLFLGADRDPSFFSRYIAVSVLCACACACVCVCVCMPKRTNCWKRNTVLNGSSPRLIASLLICHTVS